ncbi:MAG: hypothetical protein ABEK42_00550 [Thiohalorhabdaceae bacterium]
MRTTRSCGRAVYVGEAVAGELDEVAVGQVHQLQGHRHQGGGVGGEEVFSVILASSGFPWRKGYLNEPLNCVLTMG